MNHGTALASNFWTGVLLLFKAVIVSCAGMGAISDGVPDAFGPTIEEIIKESVENSEAAMSNAHNAPETKTA